MANHGVVLTSHCAQQNIDAYNRKAKAESAFDNGTALTLGALASGQLDVFTATKASAGATGIWMACSPEVNKLIVGEVYGGADPRNFTNVAGKAFDVVLPQKFDVFQMTTECFVTGKDPKTVTGATVVELTADGWEAKVSATSQYAGAGFKILKKHDLCIGNELVDAWLVECTNN